MNNTILRDSILQNIRRKAGADVEDAIIIDTMLHLHHDDRELIQTLKENYGNRGMERRKRSNKTSSGI